MLFLILTREKRIANVQLIENTAERPHVDSSIVGNAKDDLWGSVEPTLDVSVDLLILEATTTEINDFNTWFINFP